MVQFGIQVKGLEGRRDALEMVKFVTKIRKVHVKKLAEETQKVIRRVVQGEIKRPLSTGRLARYASEMEILEQGNEAGVGSLETMDQEVPYWHWQNFGVAKSGRKRPPTSIGRFAPGNPEPGADSFREGRFIQDSGASGGYLMIPTKDIEPMNYIETTWSTMFTRAPSILARATPRATGILG